jgi:hypothetical protein
MLANPCRGQENPLGLLLRPGTFADASRDLLPKGSLQGGGSELVLAEKIKLATMLESEEIGQAIFAYALSAGRSQQYAIDMSKTCRVIPEHGHG